MTGESRGMELKVPAFMEHALIVRMALSGFGVLAEMGVDLIDDLRTITDECFDCLLHQAFLAKEIRVSAGMRDGRFWCRFQAEREEASLLEPPQDVEITRCILETLLPDVRLERDENGVRSIHFSMPV